MKKLAILSVSILLLLCLYNIGFSSANTLQNNMSYSPLQISVDDNVASGSWVGNGEKITYTISYFNQNNKAVSHVIIKSYLSDDLSFVNASKGYNYQDGWVKWFKPNINSGSGGKVFLNVSINNDLKNQNIVENLVSISCNEANMSSSNVDTLIGNPTPLRIVKEDNIKGFELYENINYSINYTINVKNNNLVTISNVWITDCLPEELIFNKASKDYFVDYDNGYISWYKSSMNPNEEIDFWINTSLNQTQINKTWIINNASVDTLETGMNQTTSDPLLFNTTKRVYFSKFLFKGWNKLIIKEGTIENNDFSINYIFSSIIDKTEIIFENSTGKNCICGEAGNSLTNIKENEIYWLKMNESALLAIYEKENIEPVANPGGSYSGRINKKINFDASKSKDSDGSITHYRWDFKNNGTWTDWSKNSTSDYTYKNKKTYTVKLQVRDNAGGTDTDTATVKIENIKPTAKISGDSVGTPGEKLSFDASKSTDLDGNIVEYRWDYDGDGTWDTAWITKKTTSHKYTNEKKYTLKLNVKDNDNATDTATFSVNIRTLNNPPKRPTILTAPKNGTRGKEYNFEIVTTDSDGDRIRYFVDWGDGNESSSAYVDSGEKYVFNYSYEKSDLYLLNFYAKDDKNSGSAKVPLTFEAYEPEKKEQGFPIFLVVLIIIIIVVSVVAAILLYMYKTQGSFSFSSFKPFKSKTIKSKTETKSPKNKIVKEETATAWGEKAGTEETWD